MIGAYSVIAMRSITSGAHDRYRLLVSFDQIDEHRRGHHRGPQPVAIADPRLRDVARRNDLVRHAPDILALVIARVGIEIYTENRRKHHRREIFSIIAGLLLGL